jgi:hypothetical protein
MAAVERASDGRVRIASATGTAWSGRGDVVVRIDGGEVTRPPVVTKMESAIGKGAGRSRP